MTATSLGTLTFLFTDIEGSTPRWEHQRDAMAAALTRHDALLRAAIVLLRQAVASFRGLGMPREESWALQDLAGALIGHGELDAAAELFPPSIALRREVAPGWDVAVSLANFGELQRLRGNFAAARRLNQEGLALGAGVAYGEMFPLLNLGMLDLHDGAAESARQHLTAALRICEPLGWHGVVAGCLMGFAGVAALDGQGERSARLFGAAAALLDTLQEHLAPADESERRRLEDMARRLVDEATWDRAISEGRAMSEAAAIAYARDPDAEREGDRPPEA